MKVGRVTAENGNEDDCVAFIGKQTAESKDFANQYGMHFPELDSVPMIFALFPISGLSRVAVFRAIEESLRRLGRLDYCDQRSQSPLQIMIPCFNYD
jgi:hypothetical protein